MAKRYGLSRRSLNRGKPPAQTACIWRLGADQDPRIGTHEQANC